MWGIGGVIRSGMVHVAWENQGNKKMSKRTKDLPKSGRNREGGMILMFRSAIELK